MVIAIALLMVATLLAGSAAAAHVDCGDVITQDTTLDSDVGPCPGDGLIVTASDITLDLGGHTVFAANGEGDNSGIHLMDASGVTVQNGTVTGFDAGVAVGRGSGNTIRGLTVVDNVNDMLSPPCELGDGIVLFDSDANTVEHNRVTHNGPFGGITLVGDSDDNTIRRNQVADHDVLGRGGSGCGRADQDEGIRIEGPGADDNVVERNTVTGSLLSGIGLHGYVCNSPAPTIPVEDPNSGNVVAHNEVSGTSGSLSHGIAILQQGPARIVCPSFGNTFERNVSTNNEGDGIFVSANSHSNVFDRNVVDQNDGSGLFLHGPRFSNEFTNVGPTLFDVVSPDLPPFVEGSDYRVMPGSGSGDVTGELVAIDITLAPGADATNNPQPRDTSTSGCQQADYDAAGFQAGDVALIQRGTCTFVSKVALAIDNGASAVVMFNEGQADLNRTTHEFGAVGPVDIPVLSTEYSVGFELYQLTQAGQVVVHVITNTTNVETQAAPGAFDNVLVKNTGYGNAEFDGFDGTLEPPCDDNDWDRNRFGTVNQPCVADWNGRVGPPGHSGDAPGHQAGGGELNNRGRGDRAGAAPESD